MISGLKIFPSSGAGRFSIRFFVRMRSEQLKMCPVPATGVAAQGKIKLKTKLKKLEILKIFKLY